MKTIKTIMVVLVGYCGLYVLLRTTHILVHGRVMHNAHCGTHYMAGGDSSLLTFAAYPFYPLAVAEVIFWYAIDPLGSGSEDPKVWRPTDNLNGFD